MKWTRAHISNMMSHVMTTNPICMNLCVRRCRYANFISTTSCAASWSDCVQYPFKQTSRAMLSMLCKNCSAAKLRKICNTSLTSRSITPVLSMRNMSPSKNLAVCAITNSADRDISVPV